MSEFKNFKEKFTKNFYEKTEGKYLFEVDVDKDVLWNLYLDSFPEGTNDIYRERRWYDCSCCKQFMRNIGGTVYIDDDLSVHSIFEFNADNTTFQPVMDALDNYIKTKTITDLYLNESIKVGTDKNNELLPDGTVMTWEHFFVMIPNEWTRASRDIPTVKNDIRTRKLVFKRSLDEITMDAIDIVLELIVSNTLYKGEEWKFAIQLLKKYKEEYDSIPDENKDVYAWNRSLSVGDVVGRIRNHSIGKLLTDISLGEDLDESVRMYERIVAPTNYKRPKAIYTKRMLEDAKKTITELGYLDSLPRRYATLDDITVNNILFSNKDAAKRISGDIFDDMMADVKTSAKKFSKVEEVSADVFVKDILPTAKEIEVYLENKHVVNMVSLIAPVNKEAPTMFKWNNPYSWAYSGNITDSDIRQNVKNAGGNIHGVLRFSIQWNDGEEWDKNDLDARCVEPSGNEIYYFQKKSYHTGGWLDVDIIDPSKGEPAVENIAWSNKDKMLDGTYIFGVHCYSNRGGKGGFKAEIEFDGNIYKYEYSKPMKQNDMIVVAKVTLKNGVFTIKHELDFGESSRDIWGVKTNTFVPVSVVMYSPNYWDDQNGIGHRHYFFMLKDCVNPEGPNGFFNEYLKHELEQHKRVFEALGSRMAVEVVDDQLSGVGFSATKRNDLVVKVKGATERVMKIKF